MDILERIAVERFDADVLTLDTTAYWTDSSPARIEDPTRPGRTTAWYRARGYEQFRVSWNISGICREVRWLPRDPRVPSDEDGQNGAGQWASHGMVIG